MKLYLNIMNVHWNIPKSIGKRVFIPCQVIPQAWPPPSKCQSLPLPLHFPFYHDEHHPFLKLTQGAVLLFAWKH